MNTNTAFQINGFSRLSLLKVAEVAQILNISKSLIYRLIQSGDLPSIRLGRSVRVRPADLEQFIQNNLSEIGRVSKISGN